MTAKFIRPEPPGGGDQPERMVDLGPESEAEERNGRRLAGPRQLTDSEFIESLLVTDVRPGDLLVLRFKEKLPREAIERIYQSWSKSLKDHPAGRCKLIILDAGATLERYRFTEQQARAAGLRWDNDGTRWDGGKEPPF